MLLVEQEKNKKDAPEYHDIPHILTEPFRDYGMFLDKLPSEDKQVAVITVYGLLLKFSLEEQLYTSQVLNENSDPNQDYFTERNKESKRKRRKLASDIKKAKAFRDTLSTFDEFIDDTWELDPSLARVFIRSDIAYEKRFEYAEMMDDYIEDLEEEIFEIADISRYQHTFGRPSKADLSKYLKYVIDKHNIKATKKLKILIDKLNNN